MPPQVAVPGGTPRPRKLRLASAMIAVAMLKVVTNYDHLYLGGGNSKHLKAKLPENVSVTSNEAGMKGSAYVWCPRKPR